MSDTNVSTLRSYTLRAFGRTTEFRARSVAQLARRIYTRSHWTMPECVRLAGDLWRGRVVTAPDFDTIVLPGSFDVLEERPEEREWVA